MSTTSQRALKTTLPARAYTDAAWFALEMDRVFAGMWIAVGRTAQLAEEGAFLRRDVAGASVLIVRGAGESIRAFHNVCRHRGTRLCTAGDGVFRGSIQCPYHAWTYGLDGLLIGAPQMEEVEGFDRADYPLRDVACDTWDGHIFVNLGDAPPPLTDQLGELPRRFAPWRMHELLPAHRIEYDVAANWKLIVQNYNECLHCPVIHPLLNRMHHYLGAENVPSSEYYCGGAMGFKDGVDTLSTDGKRRRDVLPGLSERDRSQVHYFAIYPNFLLTLHPDYMTTLTIWPQDCGRTKLIAEWHFHPDEMARPDFVSGDAIEFWDRTNREDWAISEQSYLGISSRGYLPGPYSERERQLWEFDQFILKRTGHPSTALRAGGGTEARS
jgi:Rieske 2Fe-2S family protein